MKVILGPGKSLSYSINFNWLCLLSYSDPTLPIWASFIFMQVLGDLLVRLGLE